MTTSADDISIVLSGGSTNINANNSLGGNPSSSPITDAVLNNLFDDISTAESDAGNEDYRCIYVFNDGDTTIYSVKVWIFEDFEDGSAMELGIENRNEAQRITIAGGTVTGGTFDLIYNDANITSTYRSDLAQWASELQDAIEGMLNGDGDPYFKEVGVTAQTGSGGSIFFDVRWTGSDAKRSFDDFTIDNNTLTPLGTITATQSTVVQGAPVNAISVEINVETTPPGGVGFLVPTASAPITIPRLDPNDGFPLWIKRITSAGSAAKENDGLVLRISAQSLET